MAAIAAGAVFWYARALAAVRSTDEHLKAIATGAIFGVTAVLVHSLADYPLRQPAVSVSFFALAGACSGAARRKLLPFSRRRRWASWLAPSIPALGLIACLWLFSAALASSAGRHDLSSRIDPLSAEAPFLAARRLAGGGLSEESFEGARRLVEKSLRKNPMDARAVYLAGALRLLAWDARGGDGAVELASKLAPAWPDVGLKVGKYVLTRWVRTGSEDAHLRARAVEVLSRAARTRGGVRGVGKALSEAGALEELWRETLTDTPETLVFMARSALSRGDFARAVAFLEEASRRGAEVRLELATGLFLAGKPRECAARLKALGEEGIRRMRGVLFARPEKGLRVCAELREAGEGGAALEGLEGRLLLRLGDAVGATAKLLRSAEELRDPDVWADLSRAELNQGMLSRAAEHSARATELAPTRPDLRLLRGGILQEMKMLSAAEKEYRLAWLYNPRSFQTARRLAELLRARGGGGCLQGCKRPGGGGGSR